MSEFLIGAASAAHQVEGNNLNNDVWAQEHMAHSGYRTRSGLACNHYMTYRNDIEKMKAAGLNAYRFSLEWSRIEPQEGRFNQREMDHYLDMISACRENGIEPIITLFHFTSPVWLIRKGGWEAQTTVDYFRRYAEYVCNSLKDCNIRYICTINEANIGVLIAKYIAMAKQREGNGALQIGMDTQEMVKQAQAARKENLEIFGSEDPAFFVAPRSPQGIEIVKKAHKAAVEVIHSLLPGCKAGLSLSLNDIQYDPSGKTLADQLWQNEFLQFTDALTDDDYFGLQNYTRSVISENGELPPSESAILTQMGYEYYPQGLENILRKVYQTVGKEVLITENGIATDDDSLRISFIDTALRGVLRCREDGIPVSGYLYWSLIDNFEWQSGFSMQFGLMENDQDHTPKQSLHHLGNYLKKVQ